MRIFRKKREQVGLVLGGGSARGLAHLGVLEVFKREKIPVDLVVGTSVGSLMAAIYALDLDLAEVKSKTLSFSWRDLVDLGISRLGLSSGEKLASIIREIIGRRSFSDARIPLAVVTLDIENGEEVVFESGDLVSAVRASCSIPGIFSPLRIGGRLLLDGGDKYAIPVSVARQLGATFIIAVDVGFYISRTKPITNIFQIILQTYQIQKQALSRYQTMDADILIQPDLGDIDQMAFERAGEAIRAGRTAAEEKLTKIKKKLKWNMR